LGRKEWENWLNCGEEFVGAAAVALFMEGGEKL
jgi:hypothetical protein